MKSVFIESEMRPGLVVLFRGNSKFSKLLIWAQSVFLRRARPGAGKAWASHAALTVELNGMPHVGDAMPPRCRMTDISDWNKELLAGNYEARVFEVIGAANWQERAMGAWWIEHYQNRIYDWGAYPKLTFRLLVKAAAAGAAAGWRWAWFCSETVCGAIYAIFKGAVLGNRPDLPPVGLEICAGLHGGAEPATLREITAEVMTAATVEETAPEGVARPLKPGPGVVLAGCLLAALGLISSGCASMYAVGQQDARRVIQAQAFQGGGAGAGINLAALKTGYLQAWKEAPGKMTLSTLADAAAAAVAAWGVQYMADQAAENESPAAPAESPAADAPGGKVVIKGNGNTVIFR